MCHNPVNAEFSWDRLTELGTDFGIIGYRSSIDETGARNFWAMFFLEELKPLVEERLAAAGTGRFERTLPTTDEVRSLVANDFATLDLLPAFPGICQEVIQAIDAGAAFGELEEIMKADVALQASIIRTSNQTRFEAKVEVDSVGVALSVIGLDETRRMAAARAMKELASQVDQEGFDLSGFLHHCAGTGFLAQMLSLDPGSEDARAREQRRSLGLRPYICSALAAMDLWRRFELEEGFDPFSAGVLHDVGKIFNVTCYRGIYPLILYEIEQSRWRQGILESEGVVAGTFSIPAPAAHCWRSGSCFRSSWNARTIITRFSPTAHRQRSWWRWPIAWSRGFIPAKFLAEDYEEHRERFHRGANLAAANEKTLTDHEKMLAGVRNAALVGSKPEEDVPAGVASVLRRHGFKIMMVGLMLYASGSITFNVDWDKVNALLAASAKTPAAAATPK